MFLKLTIRPNNSNDNKWDRKIHQKVTTVYGVIWASNIKRWASHNILKCTSLKDMNTILEYTITEKYVYSIKVYIIERHVYNVEVVHNEKTWE